jgi:hypothetical protein
MRRQQTLRLCIILTLIAVLLITGLFGPPRLERAYTQSPVTPNVTTSPIREPESYEPEALPPKPPSIPASATSPKAVAIVGEAGDLTDDFIEDMNGAVTALETHGATVETFFYGEKIFSWSDIVTATLNTNLLLYMGQGVYSGSDCSNPTEVGGFMLGYGPIVTPDDIRNDLAGRIDRDAVVILSHTPFSAGDGACDPEGWPSQSEAERRVRMYAAPFVDIGIQAYYANSSNNANNAMITYLYALLAPIDDRESVGDIFKTSPTYKEENFRDLDYPDAAAYDLWLSGTPGDFNDAFVGIPDYIFQKEMLPEFGPLPTTIDLTYDTGTETFTSGHDTLTIENVSSNDALNWKVTQEGDWFTPTPSEGLAPDENPTVTLVPNTAVLQSLGEGQHTGALTVTITDPPQTVPRSQRVDLSVSVEGPRMGNLADTLEFVYFPEVSELIPTHHSVQPHNTGTGGALTWRVEYSGDWLTVTPATGTTPATFVVTPDTMTSQTPITRTASVTVTVTDPPGTFDRVQVIEVNLNSSEGEPGRAFLPVTMR